ncbi:MogA/MoaB family molybdenum cofactor biosynthesis protein [Cryobacterium cheniae]|uniref:MogA/MoaB family molybdenum cofactor biosynthesis protein n=1 Tax=Cryobacterium cheniae TaxID=1259262 RepID=A0A4R8XNR5_9MICO|nr:MogA/MoaB family molybdenum cofactor biosynthesis protein [Cryobacterium cheniae]
MERVTAAANHPSTPSEPTETAVPRPPRTAQVIVASTRAAAGVYPDRTGPVIDVWLRERGFTLGERRVVPDGDPVGAALIEALDAGCDLVITTGGTGVSPHDLTPEQTLPHLGRLLPGLMEEFRRRGAASTSLALISRGHAGIARGRTLVINLPGSPHGVTEGLGLLAEVLDHILDQLHGVDH